MTNKIHKTEALKRCFDRLWAIVKVYNSVHAFLIGDFSTVSCISAVLGISNAIIGILASSSLFVLWMRRRKDRSEAAVLKRFGKLRTGSLCPFARKVKLYGAGIGINQDISSGVESMIPRLIQLTKIGKKQKLDGFIVELPADHFARDLEDFSRSFNHLLRELAGRDPTGENCFRNGILKKIGSLPLTTLASL